MNTWICRILSLIFFVNCLPAQAWADSQRSARRRNRALNEQVAQQVEQYTYDQWKAEVAELEGVLQSDDLTSEERKFAQLELDTAKLNVEFLEVLGDSPDYTGTNNAYYSRIAVLEAQKEALEKQTQIRSFYQMAQSDKMIAASVYAMHKAHKDGLSNVAQAQAHSDQVLNEEWNRRGRNLEGDDMLLAPVREANAQIRRDLEVNMRANQITLEPSSLRVATPLPVDHVALAPDVSQIRDTLLARWANNTITLEELVEYADPVDTADISLGNIAAAAELLFYIFYGYNMQVAQLDQENLDSAIWLAKRIQHRAQHQLHALEAQAQANQASSLDYVQARGNLMGLAIQVQNFLSKNNTSGISESRLQELDQQLPEYTQIKNIFAGYRANMWAVSNVGTAISKDVQEAYKNKPAADSRASTLLSQQLAYVVVYLTSTGNTDELVKLVAMVNEDGETFHGKNEQYVSTIFASIFDAMINYATSEQTQKKIRQLIWCASAPECTYHGNKITNAVNVRVQALAVASMLRMAAKPADDFYSQFVATLPAELQPSDTPTRSEYISKTLFEDPEFRTWMSRYTIDIYGPAQEWNLGETKTYGLSESDRDNGLPALSNHLAKIFDSFLPVDEPKTKLVRISSGIYEGCYQLQYVTNSQNKVLLAPLNGLNKNRDQITVGRSVQGYSCFDNKRTGEHGPSNPNVRGDLNNPIVLDSRGNFHGIMYFNIPNYQRIQKALGERIMMEVGTWFLWGAAFKGLGYLWKGARALMTASRAAAKASSGFKMARFSSKFSNVWKLSTRGWETEMGLVNVTKNGDKIFVEMARPGYQGRMMEFGTEVLGGNSIKSLKGRILLRRAIQRDVIEGGVSRTFGNTLTRAEQRIVASEKAVVNAVKEDLAEMPQSFQQSLEEGASFTVTSATTEKGVPFSVIRPTETPTPWVDFRTGLPEKAIADQVTGNVTGEISGQYLGTIVTPYTQDVVAYNVAAGLTRIPSGKFMGRWLFNYYPVLQELNGLTKFALGMTALDQPVYNWYVKPYMTDFDQRQDQALASQTGYDPSEAQQPTGPKTILEQIQSLTPAEDIFGSTLQGAFLGVNQLANYVLPDWMQVFRRGLLRTTTDISSAIDDPLANALGMGEHRFLPLPGAVLSLPFVFAGDPTPTYSEAVRAQYEVMAHQQQVETAMEQHNQAVEQQSRENFKQQIDVALQDLGVNTFLTANEEMLKALPNSRKEIKRMYKVYEQALKAAKREADTDLNKAVETFNEAVQKFVDTQAEIMTRVVKAFVAQEAATTIPETISSYHQFFGDLFDTASEEQFKQDLNQYYAQREADLIAFYTVPQVAFRTNQNPQTLYDQAHQAMERHNAAFTAKLEEMDTELINRKEVRRNIENNKLSDYMEMFPSRSNQFLPEDKAQLNNVFAEFNTQVQELIAQNALSSAELQSRYEQLAATRNARFAEVKAYLIANHPEYAALFERPLLVAISSINVQKQNDYFTMRPFELSEFSPKDEEKIRNVFREFNTKVQELFNDESSLGDVEEQYEQLSAEHKAQFAAVKAELIAQHPEYAALFERTISVAIQEHRAAQQAAQAEEETPAPVPAPAQ